MYMIKRIKYVNKSRYMVDYSALCESIKNIIILMWHIGRHNNNIMGIGVSLNQTGQIITRYLNNVHTNLNQGVAMLPMLPMLKFK